MAQILKNLKKVKKLYEADRLGGSGIGPLRMISHDQDGQQF